MLIDRSGDQFFAGASLTANEHGHGRGGDAADFLVGLLHGAAIADDGVAAGDDVADFYRLKHESAGSERFLDRVEHRRRFEQFEQ